MDRNLATVHRLFDEVWNGRCFDHLHELYAPGFVADYRPYSPLRHGPDEVRAMVERAWTTFPDYHEELLDVVVSEHKAAVHLLVTGTQNGAWGPVPPSGRRVEFEEMLILTFDDDGRVSHQRGIVDNLTGLRQVGVLPTPSPPPT